MTRIQQIRDIIAASGGNSNFVSYCDGPYSFEGMGYRQYDNEVSYKIVGSGMNASQRAEACDRFRRLPDVDDAYTIRDSDNIRVFFNCRSKRSVDSRG